MDDPTDAVAALHLDVDRDAAPLDEAHRGRLKCGLGCSGCCVDDLTVFEVEADLIRRHHPSLLDGGSPHPEGACAFLDDRGACRIYEHRPYVCRTQGYPLRWLDERDEETGGAVVELRDICPLNDGPDAGPPIEELPAEQCWTLGPAEGRLAHLQRIADGGRMTRVRLRDLFSAGGRSSTGPVR
ncbi:YkgJ family cysteine cluster protein [Tautonia plasticadhaerens]|uniref:Flagellin N-methylase n=1 Tax=Tautonia plasticadhaerens TaxID=2527974 RepID=A0A518GV20_9BACT|nr:YkgJ family cysteine cluster protein [Tautonia plasticadhaerens]QDV32429.1 Flagellin N-methylase [Tautonia plasticadhaerens]